MNTETRHIYNFSEGDKFHEHYRLLAHVGSGGFADVWRAKDELVDTVVALKIYTHLDNEGINDLAKEYKRMQGIHHPNLLTGNHFDANGNIPYLEMDYCDGGNLSRKAGKMTTDELHHMLRDILGGLAYLHSESIIHQDIKPENILHDTVHDRYLLSDFGISSKSRTRMSKSINMANLSFSMTESYAPPEKFSTNAADRMPDAKGDIFSLGVTLYELATGDLPLDPPMATGREMLYSHGQMKPDFGSIADPKLREVIEACTRFRKEDRPTATEVLAILDAPAAVQEPASATKQKEPYDAPEMYGCPETGFSKQPTVKLNPEGINGEQAKKVPPTQAKGSKGGGGGKGHTWIYVVVAVVAVALGALLYSLLSNNYKRDYEWADTCVAELDSICEDDEVVADTQVAVASQQPSAQELEQQRRAEEQQRREQEKHGRQDGNNLVFNVNGVEFKMVYVSGGTYMMGCTNEQEGECDNDEYPSHSVSVGGFYMGQTEVTQALWKAVMGSNPSRWQGDNLPVESITWHEVKDFISKLNSLTGRTFRMPTEEEWEFAARGGNRSRGYKYSGSNTLASVGWYKANSGDRTHAVAQKQANELGLYDMSGNVREWCSSCWSNYGDGESDCARRVVRGGTCTYTAQGCRVSYRNADYPSPTHGICGLRLAMSR